MTQREFEALARGLARQRPETPESDAYALWERVCGEVARVCAASNPRFKSEVFVSWLAR